MPTARSGYVDVVRDTEVTFPAGEVVGTGIIEAVLPLDAQMAAAVAAADGDAGQDLVAVIVDRTPFHPVDHTWPDQPADRGLVGGVDVVTCVAGAESPEGEVFFGEQIPVRRGDPAWTWFVAHIVPAADAATHGLATGAEVPLHVGEELRRGLSRGHSACHLAALAMNQATAEFWDKDPGRTDSLGHPDLDSLTITLSRIEPDGALDVYRLGKSVRKKGLRSAELLSRLPEVQDTAQGILATWISAGGSAVIETEGDTRLTARRRWRAELPTGAVEIPCGGTHVGRLEELGAVELTYESTEDGFRVLTRVRNAADA